MSEKHTDREIKLFNQFGKRLVELRHSYLIGGLRIDRVKMADLLGVSTSTLQNWENGINLPTVEKVMLLYAYFPPHEVDHVIEPLMVYARENRGNKESAGRKIKVTDKKGKLVEPGEKGVTFKMPGWHSKHFIKTLEPILDLIGTLDTGSRN